MTGETLGFDLPPYAQSLGIFVDSLEGKLPLIACDAGEVVHGRPGFWHGGVIGGLLEIAALVAVRSALEVEGTSLKPVSFTVQFMRAATIRRSFAIGSIRRAGRRIVNVDADAWQGDRERLIASARMTIMLD